MDLTSTHAAASLRSATPAARAAGQGSDEGSWLFGSDGLSFADLLDVINPLQHIPIVSAIYRQVTGDVIDPLPRIAGGALFGGPAGAIASAVEVLVQAVSGRDLGEHAVALADSIGGDGTTDLATANTTTPAALRATGPEPAGWSAAEASPLAAYRRVLDWAQRERAHDGLRAAAATTEQTLAPPERAGRRPHWASGPRVDLLS